MTELTHSGNRAGRAIAMTLYSPVRPWYRRSPGRPSYERGALWLWGVFVVLRALPQKTQIIHDLSFIHFARWILIRRIPDFGQPREQLKHKLLMFESNYNGGFAQYVDGFAGVLKFDLSRIWGTSYGFPGPHPVTPFKDYVQTNDFIVDHYYSAYPDATTTMITSALAVRTAISDFNQQAETYEASEFADAYRKVLTDIQGKL